MPAPQARLRIGRKHVGWGTGCVILYCIAYPLLMAMAGALPGSSPAVFFAYEPFEYVRAKSDTVYHASESACHALSLLGCAVPSCEDRYFLRTRRRHLGCHPRTRKVKVESWFRGGVQHGPELWLSEDGHLLILRQWHNGRGHGMWMEWHENGRRRYTARFWHDTLVGRQLWWDEDGCPVLSSNRDSAESAERSTVR